MKKFFCVLCVAICGLLCFAGCAEVKYSVLMRTDGSIVQGFQINLDKSAIESAGYNYDDAKQHIENQLASVRSRQILRIASFKNSIINPDAISIECYVQELSNQSLYICIEFDSARTFNAYNRFTSGTTEEPAEDDEILEEHFFYVKHITRSTTAYADLANNPFAQDMLEYFDGSTEGTTAFTLDDCTYEFYYGMPSSKIYSNADKVFYQDGIKIHCWQFSASQTDNEIEIYTIEVKPVSWYLLALALTLVLVLVLLVVILIQKKFKKNTNTIADEQN